MKVYKIKLTDVEYLDLENPKKINRKSWATIPINFACNSKVVDLSAGTKWLYLGLVLLWMEGVKNIVSGGHTYMLLTDRDLVAIASRNEATEKQVMRLEQNQLLTADRIELNWRELNEIYNSNVINKEALLGLEKTRNFDQISLLDLHPTQPENKDLQKEKHSEEIEVQENKQSLEQDSSLVKKTTNEKKQDNRDYEEILELWELNRGPLPKVEAFTEKRRKAAKARWNEAPSEEYWATVIWKLAQSKFCTGDNDRGWVANFDFLLKPETHVKVTEGVYDNRTGKTKKGF